jgi:ABC-type transport system involved in multi-copper enzyme maturation permease subunit
MRIRALAWITFRGLLRNKVIVLLLAGLLCVALLGMAPLLGAKAMAGSNPEQAQTLVLALVSGLMTLVSGSGSLLAAWAAADAIAAELKSGTVMAVMARPVRRWEFLLGKYLGVQMLMVAYAIFMFALCHALAWIGGIHLATQPWVLFAYPMVRYAIYGAISMCLVTVMHPVFAFICVLFSAVLASMVVPSSNAAHFLPEWIRRALFFVLPSVNLLSESNFLAINYATLKQTPWTQHATALAYGLDYAAVFLLLAAWAFRRRALTRE